jgi:hypothetical protein
MAEIELSVFSRQCLDLRIGDEAMLKREIKKLESERNETCAKIEWHLRPKMRGVNCIVSIPQLQTDGVLVARTQDVVGQGELSAPVLSR